MHPKHCASASTISSTRNAPTGCSIPFPHIVYQYVTFDIDVDVDANAQYELLNIINICSNSSIGMAKAALEAVNGMNLFGINGASWSVIYSDIDAHFRNRINFDSFLPRESASKVVSWHRRVRLVQRAQLLPFSHQLWCISVVMFL